ncbi:hypothetical protein B0H13DRAFT_2369855 [Mycena leptocephala]|nr:hypothetical protein B0H13DRAFT_2369855 [Mycena leptocephala]
MHLNFQVKDASEDTTGYESDDDIPDLIPQDAATAAYVISYDIAFRLPARHFVPMPQVLVEHCPACCTHGESSIHLGNVYRRSNRFRGEFLEWEPCHVGWTDRERVWTALSTCSPKLPARLEHAKL